VSTMRTAVTRTRARDDTSRVKPTDYLLLDEAAAVLLPQHPLPHP
jgi:hypothetical protein